MPRDDVERERERWRNAPRERPRHAPSPGPGQESVWDYPRPPRVERVAERLRVELFAEVFAETTRGRRVIETAGPPTYYFPPEDVRTDLLEPAESRTLCEWKGVAQHWSARRGERHVANVAWSYPDPDPAFAEIRDWLAFYPARVDRCKVGDEEVRAQAGGYYGGWITSRIVGPFKGEPGSERW